MIRFAVKIAYDGSQFFGSQSQTNQNGVEDFLNKALKNINLTSSSVVLAGRTDRGVHATGSIFHVDLPDFWTPSKFQYALTRGLPPTILIKNVYLVNNNFHARFSAKSRVYRYIISQENINPFENNYLTFIQKQIDIQKIQSAIKLLEGEHDFKAFLKVGSPIESSIRFIFNAKIYKYKSKIIFLFEGNGFLRSQVRLMVGFLLKIGYGELNSIHLQRQLNGESIFREPVSPNGLYLIRIKY